MVTEILLSNDDGIHALGLKFLAQRLKKVAKVHVIAPDRNYSGASNALTLDTPLRVTTLDDGAQSVSGTPTDCVHLALTGLMEKLPDMVISGVNNGANLSDDILYSGTVAAATEGRFLGLPAMAVSLVGKEERHYDTACEVVVRLFEQLRKDPLPADTILNVNVPDVALSELEGYEVTRLGARHRAEPAIFRRDPNGRPIYWIGAAGPASDDGPGTDFHAVKRNKVSITPLKIDLTHYKAFDQVVHWLEEIT